MRGRKGVTGKVYEKYQPYPVTWDLKSEQYPSDDMKESRPKDATDNDDSSKDFHDLISDPDFPGRSFSEPLPSSHETNSRPLHLLQSLFADRLSFLQRALDELEGAKKDREQLAQYAMKELDPEIRECEISLSAMKAAMNNTERRRDLERRLFDLKRERRYECLRSWKDMVWLKNEIRKLKREIETLKGTANTADNRKSPM